MAELDLILEFWIANRLKQRRFQHISVVLSGASVPGEGELKIFRHALSGKRAFILPGDSHLVVGGDADLVLLAMAAINLEVWLLSPHLNPHLNPNPTPNPTCI